MVMEREGVFPELSQYVRHGESYRMLPCSCGSILPASLPL